MSGRASWTDLRRRKEPTLYDEWLTKEKTALQEARPSRRESGLWRRGDDGDTTAGSVASRPTIRQVAHDDGDEADTVGEPRETTEDDPAATHERGTASFERAFLPHITNTHTTTATATTTTTTTTIVGGAAAASTGGASSPPSTSASKGARLVKPDKARRREARMASHSPPSSRNGSSVAGMLARNNSRSNGHRTHAVVGGGSSSSSSSTTRPRTQTLDDRRRELSPSTRLLKNRKRVVSIAAPGVTSSDVPTAAADAASPTSPRSMTPFGSPMQDAPRRRSVSPTSTSTADGMSSPAPASSARRILHLMKQFNGRMSGNVLFRRHVENPWNQIFCYIHEDTGALMCEPRSGDGMHRTLIPDLRGCSVRPRIDGDTPYLVVTVPKLDMELHMKFQSQADFDGWYAAFLYWHEPAHGATQTNGSRSPSSSSPTSPVRPPLPPRTASATAHRERAGSSMSDRRKSAGNVFKDVPAREAPVIKIGNMIFWDTNVGYSNTPSSSHGVGPPGTARPLTFRMQSHGSRRWKRISGQLRENGELKLHADTDNSLISVVQLSQLSRCAIQRLDPSVLDNEFCIAIYPQYTSSPAESQPGFIRPIFLSLDNRVLFEVWFVLLRAFTIPQLYGPRVPSPYELDNEDPDGNLDLEGMLTNTTNDMFRMERALNIRLVEAKMQSPSASAVSPEPGFNHSKAQATSATKGDQHGYFAEVLLDNETRGKTRVKYEGLSPYWAESFEFLDLPPVLNSASVVIKRRPPENVYLREQKESKLVHEAYGFTNDQHGGFTGLTFSVTCGKVEIYLHELEDDKEVEKWWPVVNMYNQRVGEVLIKARAEESVILMARDYLPLSELLHRFGNNLTLQIAEMIPNELKRISDCLLDIFQVSGRACEWLTALVEEEIDGVQKEPASGRPRFNKRAASDVTHDAASPGSATSSRDAIVRDLNKTATVEANLLFRGNTLLTKSLDTHMRRVGKEYLEESLADKIKEINDKDPDCEVDPNRIESAQDLDRNWRRLLLYTQEVWKAIVASKNKCPVELRMMFRHIRACAEDRYGDFLRSVSFSSVSGFLFLRFFCPAVLNPKLFGLLKEDVKPRTRRTLTLIAKSLQTLSNMASFGTKEHWMEPMNAFLTQHRDSFKSFVNDMCYVPSPLSPSVIQTSSRSTPSFGARFVGAETHLSYTTPMTIMHRLPPTSREGFPSLPYLVDQARAYAELVQLWLEATTAESRPSETAVPQKSRSEIMAAIGASEGDLRAFHEICTSLHERTQECLNRAERAERPDSSLSFKWEELIEQLQPDIVGENDNVDVITDEAAIDRLAEQLANDARITAPPVQPGPQSDRSREPDITRQDDEKHNRVTRLQDPPHALTGSAAAAAAVLELSAARERPSSSGMMNSFRENFRRAHVQSRASDSAQSVSASTSNVSSNVSSDAEHPTGTTALPSYKREVRHRERREAAKALIKQEVEAARLREKEKEKERRRAKTPIASVLRKKKDRESNRNASSPSSSAAAAATAAHQEGYTSHG